MIEITIRFLLKTTNKNTEQKWCSCNLYLAENEEFQFI